jgi:hypothetical protein
LIQTAIGLIMSFSVVFLEKYTAINKKLSYILVNSLIILFYILCNLNSIFYEFTCMTLWILILFSILYIFLLKRYFS